MALINQIKEMQMNGIADADIIQQLREQGVSPLEINQALEQASIKAAIAEEDPTRSLYQNQGEMQPSVMQQTPSPQPQEQPEYYPQQPQYQGQEQQEYSQQPQYPQYYQTQNSESISEIAEQIAEEKINLFRKKIGNIDEIKVILTKKVDSMDERLKKIEAVIEKLQAAIISKVGSFGDSVEEIKNEMKMMQNSFSKVLNPIVDRAREHPQREAKAEEKHSPSKGKKSDGFEHFIRR